MEKIVKNQIIQIAGDGVGPSLALPVPGLWALYLTIRLSRDKHTEVPNYPLFHSDNVATEIGGSVPKDEQHYNF